MSDIGSVGIGDSNSEWEDVAGEVSATAQMRQEVADELTHVLGHTSITTAFLTMAPDDMRVHCLNLPQAPAYFRLPSDPWKPDPHSNSNSNDHSNSNSHSHSKY